MFILLLLGKVSETESQSSSIESESEEKETEKAYSSKSVVQSAKRASKSNPKNVNKLNKVII